MLSRRETLDGLLGPGASPLGFAKLIGFRLDQPVNARVAWMAMFRSSE